MICPDDFIPVLEREGLIHLLDTAILRQVCARLRGSIANGETPTPGWRPIAAASGTITVPDFLRVRNAGGTVNRCVLRQAGGVLYARPTTVGTVICIQ